MSEKNAFEFLTRLPDAQLTGDFEKSPGVTISGAWTGNNALVNCLHGDAVKERTYTIGISGRGTLQIPEQEYRDLLSSMISMFEYMSPNFNRVAATSFAEAAEKN